MLAWLYSRIMAHQGVRLFIPHLPKDVAGIAADYADVIANALMTLYDSGQYEHGNFWLLRDADGDIGIFSGKSDTTNITGGQVISWGDALQFLHRPSCPGGSAYKYIEFIRDMVNALIKSAEDAPANAQLIQPVDNTPWQPPCLHARRKVKRHEQKRARYISRHQRPEAGTL